MSYLTSDLNKDHSTSTCSRESGKDKDFPDFHLENPPYEEIPLKQSPKNSNYQ